MLSVNYAECRKQAHYAESRYAECHYAGCRYAECRGVLLTSSFGKPLTNFAKTFCDVNLGFYTISWRVCLLKTFLQGSNMLLSLTSKHKMSLGQIVFVIKLV